MDSIFWSVSIWASRDKAFNDVSMFDLNLFREAYFRGGCTQKTLHSFLWNPPIGVLKLNFDGSFIKDVRRGGYGGLIRESRGHTLCSYFGPVIVAESNEVEVYAMLEGCCQLKSLGGDSFSTIQWGPGKASYP